MKHFLSVIWGAKYTSWMYSKLNDRWHILTMKTRVVSWEERGHLPTVQSASKSPTWTVKVARTKKQHQKKQKTNPATHFIKAGRLIRLGAAAGGAQPYVQVQVRTHKRTQTSPCMGPLHTTLPNFNISSAQQRRSSERGGKPSMK